MNLTVEGQSKATIKLAAYLASAFESSDAGTIAHALGIAARAKGMSHVAEEAGCAREQLYRSLSKKGNPTLKTVLAILGALTAPKEIMEQPSVAKRARKSAGRRSKRRGPKLSPVPNRRLTKRRSD